MEESAIQARSWATIAATSSRTMTRAATRWPSLVMRSARVCPDLSSAGPRVSETVRMAMLTGRKGRVSSRRTIAPRQLRRRRRSIGRPGAGGERVQGGGRLAHTLLVDPIIGEHALDIVPRLAHGDAFHEQQGILLVAGQAAPFDHVAGAGVVGHQELQQIA